jgi:hypothetical protein
MAIETAETKPGRDISIILGKVNRITLQTIWLNLNIYLSDRKIRMRPKNITAMLRQKTDINPTDSWILGRDSNSVSPYYG